MPRRAGKTHGIWACLLGQCLTKPGFQVITTAQTGIKARERFLSVARILDRVNVGDYRIKRGAAAEAIEFRNGSRLWVVTPEGQAFRGDAADIVLFDEAQEHTPAATADLLGGALAVMDTKQDAQVIIAGTPGVARAGMLWDALERGRRQKIGIIEYAAPDHVEVVSLDEQGHKALNVQAMKAAHPGIGTLTNLETIKARCEALRPAQFAREYGGQWPITQTVNAIDLIKWQACQVTDLPPKPPRHILAYDIAPDQSSGALVAVWRDDAGTPWWEVVDHRMGDQWLARAIWEHCQANPHVTVAFDAIGPNQSIADRLEREARPRPRLHRLGTRDITAAAATAHAAIETGTLRVVQDIAMDAAATAAKWRKIGESRAWDRGKSDDDISPLVAATNGLKAFDTLMPTTAGTTRLYTPTV